MPFIRVRNGTELLNTFTPSYIRHTERDTTRADRSDGDDCVAIAV